MQMVADRRRRPPKHEDVLVLIRSHIDAGRYLDTRHAIDRKIEREITLPEVLHVLSTGFHEKRKDEFKALYGAWNYAIRGRTVDERELRVVVSFDDETGMIVITAIDLSC